MFDRLHGAVIGQVGAGAAESSGERHADQVNRDRTGGEAKLTLRVGFDSQLGGKIGVLHHPRTPICMTHDTDAFVGVGLADDLGGHQAIAVLGFRVQPDEQGIDDPRERVVDFACS